MVVGILQFELLIHDAQSLKDKRSVVKSLKDRLHREHLVSVAEVASHDDHATAVLGLALVGADGRRVAEVLDQISAKLRQLQGLGYQAELGALSRELIHGQAGELSPNPQTHDPDDDTALALELTRRASSLSTELPTT
jgi:uncharacterized protein YlxP (DUF503 family)